MPLYAAVLGSFITFLASPFIIGLFLLAITRMKRSRRWLVVAIWASSCESLCVLESYSEIHHFDGVTFNIALAEADLIGSWAARDDILTFRADGTYRESNGDSGEWRLDQGNREVHIKGHAFCAIRRYGGLRLIRDGLERDPDEWRLADAYMKLPNAVRASPDVFLPEPLLH